MPRHGVAPQGGYSMPRHRVPGGTRCLGTVYPPRGGTPCLGIVYRGVFCAEAWFTPGYKVPGGKRCRLHRIQAEF